MRGVTPISVQVPTAGYVVNVPPHQAPPNSLIDGSFNVYVDIDGMLKTRSGYSPVASNGSGLNPKDYPIGLLCYEDNTTDQFVIVVQCINTWQSLINNLWVNITNPGFPTTGSFDLPAQFSVMFESGTSAVYGTNWVNQLRRWVFGQAQYAAVPAAPAQARSIEVVANRIMVGYTVEGGKTYSSRIRWSALNDGTTWPTLGFIDLPGTSSGLDSIITIKSLNRLTVAIYRTNSIWLATAQPGTDATAFSVELAPNAFGIAGPTCSAALVAHAGTHYYFGQDGRIWQFDGITAQPISQQIDPFTFAYFNPDFLRRTSAAYQPLKRQFWFFFPTNTVFQPQPTPWIDAPALDGNVPSTAVLYDIDRQVFMPPQVFNWDNITCATACEETSSLDWSNWVPTSISWTQVPYVSWTSIPNTNQYSMYIGTEAGYIHRFFVSPTDNQHPISFNATYPLVAMPNLTQNLKVNWVEYYLKPIPTGPTGIPAQEEAIEGDIRGFIQPLDNNPLEVMSLAIALSDQTTFFAPVEPGPTNPSNMPLNWVQVRMQGAGNPTSGNFVFAGATIYCYPDSKPDYQSSAGIPTR